MRSHDGAVISKKFNKHFAIRKVMGLHEQFWFVSPWKIFNPKKTLAVVESPSDLLGAGLRA